MDFGLIGIVVLFFFVLVIIMLVIKIVLQGQEFMVECFGCFMWIFMFGFYFIVLFVDGIGYKMNMCECVFDVFNQDVIIKDNVIVLVDVVVFIQVMDVLCVVYEVDNFDFVIINLVLMNVWIVVGFMDFDEILFKWDEINVCLLFVIDVVINFWGVKVIWIEICDLLLFMDIIEVMVCQMKVECFKCVEILEVEGVKQFQILWVEGEKEVVICEVEGCKVFVFFDVEVCECEVEVEVKVIEMVFDVIGKGDVFVINYFLGQKYVDVFVNFVISDQQKIVIILVEFFNIIGIIIGVGELGKVVYKVVSEVMYKD